MRVRFNDILFLTIFTAPLMFFSVGGGSLFKIFGVITLFVYLYELVLYKKVKISSENRYWGTLKCYLYYAVVIQLVFGVLGQILYGGYDTEFSSSPIVRLGTQLFAFSYLSVIGIYIYRAAIVDPTTITKPFLRSIKLLLFVSVYELFSIYIGLPNIPMYIINSKDSLVHENVTTVLSAVRVHSLAGEPRFYATILVVIFNSALFYIFDIVDTLSTKDKLKWMLLLIYVLFLILYTQSTSGLILMGVLTPCTFFIAKSISAAKKTKMLLFFVLALVVLSPIWLDVVENRLIARISKEVLSAKDTQLTAFINIPILGRVSLDATDVTPAALMIDKPWLMITGVGFGNTSTYVKPYLPNYGGYWGYDYKGIVESNIALIRSILSYGVVGNLILILLFIRFYKHYKIYYSRYTRMQLASFYLMTSVFVASYILTSPMLVPFWFFSFHAALLEVPQK